MRDEEIIIPPTLTTAQSAVLYVLKRIPLDADLRHHMLDTEAFARLCAAEAERTGKTAEDVEEFFSTSKRDEKPRLFEAREALDKIDELTFEASCPTCRRVREITQRHV